MDDDAGRERRARTKPAARRRARARPGVDAGGSSGSFGSFGSSGSAGPRDHDSPSTDPEATARQLCLGWLSTRPHTRAELAEKLRRRDVPVAAADAVLDRYADVGLVDDAAFAAAWVESRHAGRGLARRALAHELRARGVEPTTVQGAVDLLDEQDEESRARELVTRRVVAMASLPVDVRTRRLLGMLARKGYAGGLAARVVRDVVRTADAETDDG